jgi:hypothetical protein
VLIFLAIVGGFIVVLFALAAIVDRRSTLRGVPREPFKPMSRREMRRALSTRMPDQYRDPKQRKFWE